MLSLDEHSGIVTFLIGIVVVVLTAVGLSIVVEKRFVFSSDGLRLENEVKSLAEQLDDLRERLGEESARLASEGARDKAVEALREAKAQAAQASKTKQEVTTARDSLLDGIRSAEMEFSEYRENYRRVTRERAVGEELGTLTLKDGRSYSEAAITRVTDVGLEIRHSHGFVRIHAPQLGEEWQERFQWSDEERRTRLAEEEMARERMALAAPAVKAPEPTRVVAGGKRPVPQLPAVAGEEVIKLRTLFSAWRGKVARLESELDEAVANGARSKSVPGSLETWSARAARLRGEVSKARLELDVARVNLAGVSPGDPLLMIPPSRP